jgi:hypothetical protein
MKFIQQVQSSLEKMNGFEQQLSVSEFIVPSKVINQIIIKEESDEAEVLICLKANLLEKLATKNFPEDFHLDLLPDLSIVVEELSHFNTYCLSAFQSREISPLALEVQGEVDKFSVAVEFLHQRNEEELTDEVFDRLFGSCQVASWVDPALRERYIDAHAIARNFCRGLLQKNPNYDELCSEFRHFFARGRSEKLALK